MSSKHEKDKQKALQEKYQAILYGLLRDEDNKYCVDCDAKGPRWASWNLGVFLCIRCAGIHRNLGVHVSRVKSVNLDAWTEEQVAMMKEIGNSRGRAVYEANIPDNFRRPQTDSSLETFIRAKYEQKKYIASEWVPPKPKALVLHTDNTSNIPSKAIHNSTGIRDPRGSTKLATTQAKPLDTPKISSSVCATPTPIAEKGVQETKNGEVDLLGLDDPLPVGENCQKDIFGEFLSNTQQPQTQPTQQSIGDPSPLAGTSQPQNSINPNDTSLFDAASSATSTPSENKKVSKDAILALYGPPQASGPAMYGGGLMMDPNQSMMGHMALIQGQPINGQIPLQSSMIGQPAMMGGVSMAAMMNPQVPLLMGGAPQLQGQMNPSLYNIQQIQNQMVGLNLASQHQTQPSFYQQQHPQHGAVQPGFYQAPLPGQQFFQQPQQNSNMFQSPTQQGALSYPGNASLAPGVGTIPNARPSPAQVPGWSNCLPHQPAQPPMTGNFWQ